MKWSSLSFLLFLSASALAQTKDFLFVGNTSGTPRLYAINEYEQQPAHPLKGVRAWNLLTGGRDSLHTTDVAIASQEFFNYFSWSRLVRAGKDDLYRLCMVGDSMLAFDDKKRVCFGMPMNGTFKKSNVISSLTEAYRGERKAQQKFLVHYDHYNRQIFFIRQGALCRVSLLNLESVEEVIKPIGGLRIIGFWVLDKGRKVLLKFVPSNIPWNEWSRAYHDEVLRLFDLASGKPMQGLNLRNGMTTVISADGKQILSVTTEDGIHKGWLYDVEQGKELRQYGPAIVQRTNTYIWRSFIDDRYLYTVPTPYFQKGAYSPKFVKVYDLLDSLKPVNFFETAISPSAQPPVLKASALPVKLPASITLPQIIKSLQELTLPLMLNTFYRPVPGKEVPPKMWESFEFYLNRTPMGSAGVPNVADSAAGNFRLYAVGSLANTKAGTTFLMASQLFVNRNPELSENETYSTLNYWLCTYDYATGKVTRQRLIVTDDRFYVTEVVLNDLKTATIQKRGTKDLFISTSSYSHFSFDTESFQIK